MDITRWLEEQERDLLLLVEEAYGGFTMDEPQYQPGDLIWCSGYYPPIKAVFVKYYRSRVAIAVQMRDGSWKPKRVTLEYIEKREK